MLFRLRFTVLRFLSLILDTLYLLPTWVSPNSSFVFLLVRRTLSSFPSPSSILRPSLHSLALHSFWIHSVHFPQLSNSYSWLCRSKGCSHFSKYSQSPHLNLLSKYSQSPLPYPSSWHYPFFNFPLIFILIPFFLFLFLFLFSLDLIYFLLLSFSFPKRHNPPYFYSILLILFLFQLILTFPSFSSSLSSIPSSFS